MKQLIFLLFLSSCQIAPKKLSPKLVLISIDGFRPEFYLDSSFHAPTLKKLAKKGVASSGMVSIFPSVTYPNHTTMVTGKSSSEHGIYSNTKFNDKIGPTLEWYWYAKDIKVETLWQRLKEKNLKSASLHWPVSTGAKIDYNIPEIFQLPPWHLEPSFELVRKYGTNGLADEVNKATAQKAYTNMQEADLWAAKAFQYIYRKKQPDFFALHLIFADKNQHETGRDSQETKAAVTWIDQRVKQVVDVLDKNTCLMITGDHGFMNYKNLIHLNTLFHERGWLSLNDKGEIIDYKVVAHKSGAQAAIYLKERNLYPNVMRLLRNNQSLGYTLISSKELKRFKAYPNAIAAVSAKDGFALGSRTTGEFIEKLEYTRGQHGHIPDQKQMHTGFLAYNCHLKEVETKLSMLQIYPTILDYFKLEIPQEMKHLPLVKN